MKAIIYKEFGPPEVLRLGEVAKPVPRDNEILVRVHAASVGYGDLVARNFKNIPVSDFHMPLPLWLPSKVYFGLSKPRVNILGSEFSGEVEEVGVDTDGTLNVGRQAMRDCLGATSGFSGITGTLTCDQYGDCADPKIAVNEIQDGEYVAIWP